MLVFRSPSVQIKIKEFVFTKDTVDWGQRWRSDERILFRQFGLGSNPGVDALHTWVEFFVGSSTCSERFYLPIS